MRRLIIAVVALGLAVGVTGPKLLKMAKISGLMDGAVPRTVVVSEKWHQTAAEHPAGRDVYWVSWGEGDIKSVGPHRLNFEKERWDGLNVGDELQLTTMPGDSRVYAQDGIFASKGNFVFDGVLLLLELGVGIFSLVALVRGNF